MENYSHNFFLEINNKDFVFTVCEKKEIDKFKIIHTSRIPIEGIKDKKISNYDSLLSSLKENVYAIEQKLGFTFNEIILVLDNLDYSLINLSGFKKLNGSQLRKENITYILNSQKSIIDNFENDKKIVHIFNTNYFLDKKKIDNLPIGLFGDFYSQELTFFLIKRNDYKNLKEIFDKCNLRIKKIVLKSFIDGVSLIDTKKNLDTFFKLDLNENDSKLIYYENSALKFSENFDFGTDIICKDISKILSIKVENVKKLISESVISENFQENEFLDKKYFHVERFRKIKKKLIFEIANARAQEISEILLFKNINLISFLKKETPIFIDLADKKSLLCFQDCYRNSFSQNNKFTIQFLKEEDLINIYLSAAKIIHFGWKKEAVPFVQTRKSLIARFFDLLFH